MPSAAETVYATGTRLLRAMWEREGVGTARAETMLALVAACLHAPSPACRASSLRDIYFSVVREAQSRGYSAAFIDSIVQVTAKALVTASLRPPLPLLLPLPLLPLQRCMALCTRSLVGIKRTSG